MKLSAQRRRVFLDELARHGIVIRAARAASPHAGERAALKTFYNARERDPEFAEAWDNAIATATSVVESELHRRAVEGYEEPVYQRGEKVGTVRRYSDRLLELRAKALLPHYRERAGDINVTATAQAAAVASVDLEAQLKQLDAAGQHALRLVATQLLAAKGADNMDADERMLVERSRRIMADAERVRAYRQPRRALAADAEPRRVAPPIIDVTPAPPLGQELPTPEPEALDEPALPAAQESGKVLVMAPQLFGRRTRPDRY